MTPVSPPLSGPLTFDPRKPPRALRLSAGVLRPEETLFLRSTGLHRPGVVAHYREHVPVHSAHMYIIRTREGAYRWEVSHLDDYHPATAPGLHLLEILR